MSAWVALLLTTLSWAATFHVANYAVSQMAPAEAATWRFVVAALVMVPVATLRDGWNWAALRRNGVALLILGGFGICGFQLGMFYGLQSSSALNAALITSLSPALTVLLVSLMEWRAMSARRWLGLLLGLAGVVVVTGGSWAALRALSVGRGDLWLTMGAVTWAVYAMILRRYVRGMSVLQITAATILVSALVIEVGTTLVSGRPVHLPPSTTWLALAFMGIVGSGLAYLWWNSAVIKLGAARAAASLNLIPVFTAAIGIALGELVSIAQLVGAVLVIAGVILATREA